jgi:hypothetical protein
MAQRLQLANQDLLQAYKVTSSFQGKVAGAMLNVTVGRGDDRENMEQWFERAMEADGDNFPACGVKSIFLEPKWYGALHEARAFCEACLATGNLEGGLPLVYEHGLKNWAFYAPDRNAYFQQPELWDEVSEFFEMYMKAFPKAKRHQGRLANWAWTCGQVEEAARLLDGLGETAPLTAFLTPEEFQTLKSRVDLEMSFRRFQKKK